MEAEISWEAEMEAVPYEEEFQEPQRQPKPLPDPFEPGF
jgi:hypothetical protein